MELFNGGNGEYQSGNTKYRASDISNEYTMEIGRRF